MFLSQRLLLLERQMSVFQSVCPLVLYRTTYYLRIIWNYQNSCFFCFVFFYNLGMFLKPIIILSLQKVLIVCLRRALRQWEPLWNRLSFYGFNSVFGMLSVLLLFSWCAIESPCAQWKNIKREKCFPFVFSWTQSCHCWNMLMFCVNYFRWAMCSKWELTMHWVILFDCFGVDGVW